MWWVRANPRFQDQSPDLRHTHLTCQIEKGKGSHLFSTLMKLLLHLGEWGGGRLPPHSGAPQRVTRGEQHHTYWWTADTPVPQEPPWPNRSGLTPGVGRGWELWEEPCVGSVPRVYVATCFQHQPEWGRSKSTNCHFRLCFESIMRMRLMISFENYSWKSLFL